MNSTVVNTFEHGKYQVRIVQVLDNLPDKVYRYYIYRMCYGCNGYWRYFQSHKGLFFTEDEAIKAAVKHIDEELTL